MFNYLINVKSGAILGSAFKRPDGWYYMPHVAGLRTSTKGHPTKEAAAARHVRHGARWVTVEDNRSASGIAQAVQEEYQRGEPCCLCLHGAKADQAKCPRGASPELAKVRGVCAKYELPV